MKNSDWPRWDEIQNILSGFSATFAAGNMSKWLHYWNHQIYKSLDACYKIGLEDLYEKMENVRCELVFIDQIKFHLSLTSLRMKCYTKLKFFIKFPGYKFEGLNFEGSNDSDMFKIMPLRNSSHTVHVYMKFENLFHQIKDLLFRLGTPV